MPKLLSIVAVTIPLLATILADVLMIYPVHPNIGCGPETLMKFLKLDGV